MAKENAILNDEYMLDEEFAEAFDFDELEEKLQSQLEEDFSNLEFLKEEKEKIGNPDALGKIILDEVWNQFGNQIGLDMTNETLNQKYDREHQGETYEDVGKKVMQDPKYKEANKAMKEQQQSGNLIDEYTSKNINQNDNANLDHVVARKELYENARRKQAGINTEDLANKDENLKPTNESLNKSKGAKSVDEYTGDREQREKALREQNERANKKIDESNMSDVEKQKAKEKNNKRLQDKLDADDELMKKADKEARKAINKDIAKGVAKETAKEAGKDALKQMAVSALFSLLKEVMNGFVRFLKSGAKSFKSFLEEMKKAIKSFFEKLTNVLHTGASSVVGTIVTEIFGPIVSTFKKLASLIKQGVSSVLEAVRYLNDKENKNKPFSIIQIHQKELVALAATGAEHKESIDTLFKNLAEAEKYAVDSRNSITELETFSAEVSALNHLMEIDEIWKQTEDHQIRINRVEQDGKSHTDKLNELFQADVKMRESIDSNESDINGLKEYRDKLGGV